MESQAIVIEKTKEEHMTSKKTAGLSKGRVIHSPHAIFYKLHGGKIKGIWLKLNNFDNIVTVLKSS